MTKAKGKLRHFFRADAKRVFILSSSDESKRFKSLDFKSVMEAQVVNNYEVNAFLSDAKDESCKAEKSRIRKARKKGEDIRKLALQSGGKVFSNCKAEWKKRFKDLARSMLQKSNDSIMLPEKSLVKQVTLDDVVLSKAQYKVADDNRLYVSKDVTKDLGQKLKVKVEQVREKKAAKTKKIKELKEKKARR